MHTYCVAALWSRLIVNRQEFVLDQTRVYRRVAPRGALPPSLKCTLVGEGGSGGFGRSIV